MIHSCCTSAVCPACFVLRHLCMIAYDSNTTETVTIQHNNNPRAVSPMNTTGGSPHGATSPLIKHDAWKSNTNNNPQGVNTSENHNHAKPIASPRQPVVTLASTATTVREGTRTIASSS
jgi:hypothetical protein